MENTVVVIASHRKNDGLHIAGGFLEKGANVALLFNEEEASRSGSKHVFECHVNDFQQKTVDQAVDQIVSELGQIHVLINNCHAYHFSSFVSENENWTDVLLANVSPVFNVTKSVVRTMSGRPYGSIVNVIEKEWLGSANETVYAMANGALVSFTRSLALELAQEQITVNAVIRGVTKGFDCERDDDLVKIQPIPRKGSLEELNHAIMYLSNMENRYVTGQTLYVCGGLSLYSSLSI